MDRRRFIPGRDGLDLEGRALMSAGVSAAPASAAAEVAPLSQAQQRAQPPAPAEPRAEPPTPAEQRAALQAMRIERLPFFLRQIAPQRFLPEDIVLEIQEDLRAIQGQLKSPPTAVITVFNRQLREAQRFQALRVEDALALNRAFGDVLLAAGATPEITSRFQDAMNALAHVDVLGRQPVVLATNDYGLVLQTVLGVGRPPEVAPPPPSPLAMPQEPPPPGPLRR